MPRVTGTDTTPPREEDFIYVSQEDSGELGRQGEIPADSGYRLVTGLARVSDLLECLELVLQRIVD